MIISSPANGQGLKEGTKRRNFRMSTFKGVVKEFPDIRIDYFREIQEKPKPLACFLSHVHSDHLQGLDSFRSTIIYCSPATRELLLRLETYSHRMNFHQGILEARKQRYKDLKTRLTPIALNTPTEIELRPKMSLRVTLLDVISSRRRLTELTSFRPIIVPARSCFLSKAMLEQYFTQETFDPNLGGLIL